jgi:hypothetical protein
MIRNLLFPAVLFLGAIFNGYVMPRRIQRQIADGSLGAKIGGRFRLLWRCWGLVFLALGIFTIVLTLRRK